MGIQFYTAIGELIYESPWKAGLNHNKHEILLKAGEKIIGFQSRKANDYQAYHSDF